MFPHRNCPHSEKQLGVRESPRSRTARDLGHLASLWSRIGVILSEVKSAAADERSRLACPSAAEGTVIPASNLPRFGEVARGQRNPQVSNPARPGAPGLTLGLD